MKFVVTAICLSTTGEVIAPARDEEIDTETNELFMGATRPWEIEDTYEAFWNRLSPSWEHDFPPYKEKVKVVNVQEVA